MPHVSKKQKIRAKQAVAQENLPPCHITKLPFELIAEVLMYTNSPQDVLSLCRASKFFCRTLLSSPAEYIWRHARAHALPTPLPDKPKYLTESAYAALAYDPGNCEVCGKAVGRYTSFALRLYLCRGHKCKEEMKRRITLVDPQRPPTPGVPRLPEWQLNIINSVIVAESTRLIELYPGISTSWPAGERAIRTVDWNRAIESHVESSAQPSASAANARNLARMARKTAIMMPFYKSLNAWALTHSQTYERIVGDNEKFIRDLTEQRELEHWDFTNTKAFMLMKRSLNRSLQLMVAKDIDDNMELIRSQMDDLAQRRSNRRAEGQYAKARAQVSAHYSRMLSKPSNLPLPPLPIFRKLPFVATLQMNHDALKVDKEIETQVASFMIQRELNDWRKMVKGHLLGILGISASKVAEKEVHPVERVNARFICTKCTHLEAKYQGAGGFDWHGACGHQCPAMGKKKVEEWQPHRFSKDEKAVRAINKVLDLANIDAASSNAQADFVAIGARILCKSCPGVIVLSSTQLVGHSHRHETMDVELLEKEEAEVILRYSLTTGQAVKLANNHEGRLNYFREKRIYGCRHCLQRRDVDDRETTATSQEMTLADDADGKSTMSKNAKQQSGLTWHGLRSHLTARHKLKDARDEDFYTTEELVLKKPPPKAPLQKIV